MTDRNSDRAFADRVLARVPAEVPSPGYEAALLAAYDAWNARRRHGRWAALGAGLRQVSDTIWPGAPLWAPASAFAFALLVGASLGVALPLQGGQSVFSLEQPASFSLLSPGPAQEDI